MSIKRFIPNIITSMNLICGIVGVIFAFKARFDYAFYLMLLAMTCDFLDGFAFYGENLAKELKKINLIKEDKEVSKYYFHGVSHHLGLDTHDACIYNTKLVPGCIITVEPGLYIPEWNIGIRIEDDVLITKFGCENLSSQIIKTDEEIEEYMAKHNKYINK